MPRGQSPCKVITATGNLIYPSGAPNWGTITDKYQSAQVRFEGVRGLTFVSNTMNSGRDDGGRGQWSPDYAMVLKDCAQTSDQGQYDVRSRPKELICDLGGHGENFILKDNVGTLRQAGS